jgi:hypothetical protein
MAMSSQRRQVPGGERDEIDEKTRRENELVRKIFGDQLISNLTGIFLIVVSYPQPHIIKM